ncbi:MAG: hypothetical protein IJG56_04510 [Clostridia bacterium]|nr:hypothetical protein [Clostridia bacterium]
MINPAWLQKRSSQNKKNSAEEQSAARRSKTEKEAASKRPKLRIMLCHSKVANQKQAGAVCRNSQQQKTRRQQEGQGKQQKEVREAETLKKVDKTTARKIAEGQHCTGAEKNPKEGKGRVKKNRKQKDKGKNGRNPVRRRLCPQQRAGQVAEKRKGKHENVLRML